jgi:hypothetical protein
VIVAVFDGTAIHPNEPLELPPNTRVRLTIEVSTPSATPGSFVRTARSLGLSGPPDWSRNLETYVYGQQPHSE